VQGRSVLLTTGNYRKIFLVDLKIVCCPNAAMVKKQTAKFQKKSFKHCSEPLPKTNVKIFLYKSVV
jgi:hypothetical protein